VAKPEDDKPKPRPPPPTPILLPYFTHTTADISPEDLQRITAAQIREALIKKTPAKWSPTTLSRLNCQLKLDQPLEELVPEAYLPCPSWSDRPDMTQGTGDVNMDGEMLSSQTLSNGAAIPGHEAYFVREQELVLDSDDAYRTLKRRPLAKNKKAVKLIHYRKFWVVLEQVGGFWDTSNDDYQPEIQAESSAPDIRDKMDVDQTPEKSWFQKPAVKAAHQSPLSRNGQQDVNVAAGAAPATDGAQDPQTSKHDSAAQSSPTPPSTDAQVTTSLHPEAPSTTSSDDQDPPYHGNRHSSGSSMPHTLRVELVSTFLTPLTQAFGCHLEPVQPGSRYGKSRHFVQVLNGRIEVDFMTGIVYRGPKDQKLARQGWQEGPVMAVSCRSELRFRGRDDRGGCVSEASGSSEQAKSYNGRQFGGNTDQLDAAVEMGILLALAQWRARNADSNAEVSVGKDQWWAAKRRYGGHEKRGEAVGEPLVEDDESPEKPLEDIHGVEKTINDRVSEILGRSERSDVQAPGVKRLRADEQATQEVNGHSNGSGGTSQKDGNGRRGNGNGLPSSAHEKRERAARMRRKRVALSWQLPRAVWAPKTRFAAVGKGAADAFDTVSAARSHGPAPHC